MFRRGHDTNMYLNRVLRKRKRMAYRLTRPVLRLCPFRWLRGTAPFNLLHVVYHAVSNEPLPHLRQLYRVRSTDVFRADLDFLARHFKPAGIDELRHVIGGGRLAHPHFLVSFDDGLRQVYDYAVPILQERRLTAILFINPAFVGNADLMFRLKESAGHSVPAPIDWPAYVHAHRPYMDLAQLEELHRAGFIIGAHSMDHPKYSTLSLDQQIQQTRDSMQYVIQHFNPSLRLFAFPFTDDGVSMRFFQELVASDIVDATFGAAGVKRDSAERQLQRLPMEDYTGSCSSVLRFECALSKARRLVGRDTIQRA